MFWGANSGLGNLGAEGRNTRSYAVPGLGDIAEGGVFAKSFAVVVVGGSALVFSSELLSWANFWSKIQAYLGSFCPLAVDLWQDKL